MSIYCNCRHCVAPKVQTVTLTESAPTPYIGLEELVNEYVALSDEDFQMHWQAVMVADGKRVSSGWDDDDE